MTTALRASTPQFRTALIRKLKNIAPDFEAEFLEAERGIAFIMKDRRGRVRSKRVSIYRNNGNALERRWIEGRLKMAGFPIPNR
jgi:hypothetical protein